MFKEQFEEIQRRLRGGVQAIAVRQVEQIEQMATGKEDHKFRMKVKAVEPIPCPNPPINPLFKYTLHIFFYLLVYLFINLFV